MIEDRKKEQERRKEFAMIHLDKAGIELTYESDSEINFIHNGHTVKFFPLTGWFTGKSVKDGRGLKNLLKEIRK